MKIFLCFVLLLNIFSCSLYFRENKQLDKDYKYLSSEEFAKKYYTLYEEKHELTDSAIFHKVYYSPQNNHRAKFVYFTKNNYTFESLPFEVNQPIVDSVNSSKPIKLTRANYYSIQDSIIKIESIAQNPGSVYTIIREGVIKEDKIIIQKQYTGRRRGKKKINKELIYIKELQIYQLGEHYYVGFK